MTRYLSRGIAVTIVLGAVLVTAGPAPTSFRANPPVQVVSVSGSGSASGSLTLVNETSDPVTVTSFERDATCHAAVTVTPMGGVFPFTVAAAASKPVTVHCAAMQASGIQHCLIHVLDQNAERMFDFEPVCEYAGLPTLAPSTPSLMFGSVTIGDTVSMPMSVSNQSATTITRLFFLTDDLEGNFKVGAPCNPDQRQCAATITGVAQGESASFNVLCSPVSPGTHVASLYIATDTGQHLPNAPDVISLSCTGVAASTPVITVLPSSIDVGAVEVLGTIASSSVRIKNVGGGTLQLTDVRIVDGGNGAAANWSYTSTGACTGTIDTQCSLTAGQLVDLELSFDPSSIGTREATLLIAYHDTADRSTSVPLSGLGQGATLELVDGPTTLDFGAVPVNAMSQVTFQLANHGNRAVPDVALTAMPPGPPFTLNPATMVMVATTTPTTITATCRPTAAGTFKTTLQATASDLFMSPPIEIEATCEGTNLPLHASPASIQLGEIRTGTSPAPVPLMLLSAGGPLSITSVALEAENFNLTITATTPATTPAPIHLVVDPMADGDLANAIVVTASNGNVVRIPITGKIATASYLPPPAVSLGTFCVNQPTTPGRVELLATGSAMIHLTEPVLDLGTMSPFDLTFSAPSIYPSTLRGGETAMVQITPKRQALAGVHTDGLVWTTDVTSMPTARTPITATFVDNGGAIAPPMLAFGQATIHIDTKNGQSVTLQNCDTTPVMIENPTIPPPFSIDSPNFPTVLMPNESATFSVGFHPTRVGPFLTTLTIESPQLQEPLVVALSGEGVTTGGGGGDAGTDVAPVDQTSFYACDGCSSNQPAGVILIVLAVLGAVIPRRRRAC